MIKSFIVTCIFCTISAIIFLGNKFCQGFNARKGISEVYASFVLQCIVTGGNVNTRRMSKPDMWSIFHINNQWNILVIGKYYVNYQNSMLLTSSDTKRRLMYIFLFTNSAQREPVSICKQSIQSIHNCN